MTTRDLPRDLDAEAALLGAVLLDPDAMAATAEVVKTDDFYSEPHRLLYSVAQDVAVSGSGPLDEVRIRHALDDRGLLVRVGGARFLSDLLDQVPDVANVEHYAGIVREMSARRRLIGAATRAASRAAAGSASAEVAEELLEAVATLGDRSDQRRETDLGRLARQVATRVLEVHHTGVGGSGVLTGITAVDELLQGLKTGLYYLAGRPGCGKSTMADQIAVKVAQTTGRPVLIFVTEMSPEQRAARQVAAVTGIPLPRLHAGRLTANEHEMLQRVARSDIGFPQVRIESAVGRTAAQVRLAAKRFAALSGPPVLVVVDYLQQLRSANPRASMAERAGEKSAQLNELAQELEVPLLVCSQLSREVEKEKRPPRLSDLRESGDLEQDAYAVAFLHRPDRDDLTRVSFLLEKHRDGPTGRASLRFHPDHMAFTGWVP